MAWIVVCGTLIFLLSSYGVGTIITGEDGWLALGVGIVAAAILVFLVGGLFYGLGQMSCIYPIEQV